MDPDENQGGQGQTDPGQGGTGDLGQPADQQTPPAADEPVPDAGTPEEVPPPPPAETPQPEDNPGTGEPQAA